MAIRTEERTKAFGAPTPSELRQRTEIAQERDARAARRFQLAQVLANVSGSLRDKRRFVAQAMESGLLPGGPLPAVATIRDLTARWEDGDQSIEDYYDRHRAGRPQKALPRVIELQIQKVLTSGMGINAHELTESLRQLAAENGVRPPTYRQVHLRFAKAGRLLRSAARHGSRAGEIDGLPHARVVTRYAHDTWALDELTLPVWVRVFYRPTRKWISILVDIVLVVDVCSGAVIGYHVVDPTRRLDDNGIPMLSGFDSEDVLLALLCAACPELATDATAEFAGYLPDRLRWDNAQPHKRLRRLFEDAQMGFEVTPIRVRRAASNGAVERRVKIIKARCAGILGHVDDYLPTDQVHNEATADLPHYRTLLAAYTSDRETRREPILPGHLHTIDELREVFDRIVYRYNYEHINRMHGSTAADRYQLKRKPRRPRRGRDLVRVIEPKTVTVGTSGIVYSDRGVSHQFYPMFEGRLTLLDQPVTFHADPSGRGIFIREPDDRLVFLPPQRSWSEEEAADVARNHRAIARTISDGADALRTEDMKQAFGPQGVDAAAKEYEVQVARLRDNGGNSPVPEDQPENHLPVRQREPDVADLWMNDDPLAFIRPLAVDVDDEE